MAAACIPTKLAELDDLQRQLSQIEAQNQTLMNEITECKQKCTEKRTRAIEIIDQLKQVIDAAVHIIVDACNRS